MPTTRVKVEREKIGREIRAKIGRDNEVRLRTKRVAEEVRAYWRDVEAPKPGPDHPYATGSYADSIQIKRNRGGIGRFIDGWTVYSNHPDANFIEFGTGPDKPGSRSPWGPNTPTPEFAPAARTAIHFRGSAP